MNVFRRFPIKVKINDLKNLKHGDKVIVEGYVDSVAPTKLDRISSYIFVDPNSPVQRALYLMMNSSTTYIFLTDDGRNYVKIVNVPLGVFYEGMRARILCKVVKKKNEIYLKYVKVL